ncbi:MAG: hypothetical protein RLZZ58_1454 [Pseudomonadota bacterium]
MNFMRHGAATFMALILAMLLANWATQPPPLRAPADIGAGIDISRAMADLNVIAREPHVTGSPANARVRDDIVKMLAATGLTAEIQRGVAVRQSPRKGKSISVAPVENIIAVAPGKDRAAPAVLVMAHYDSVPFSLGASDDGAGTVSALAAARMITAGPTPARDVIFLITDGEEMGLTGAQYFFDNHPLAKRVGIVVNAEARGSRGRAQMFQTSPGNAALVDLWADHAISPSGNSLNDAIYRSLPNDTDLSVSLDKGIAGINGAFIDGHFDYHSTTDRADVIDQRTLQHLGDFALTTTRVLAYAPALPVRGADSVFFDMFGQFVVQYPKWMGWIPLLFAAAGLGLLYRRAADLSWRRKGGAVAGVIVATAALAAVGHGIGVLTRGAGSIGLREAMAEADVLMLALIGLALAAWLVLRAGRALMLAAMLVLLAAAVAVQVMLPAAAFLIAWPVLIAVAIALAAPLRARYRWPVTAICVVLAALALAYIFQFVVQGYVSVGLMTTGIFAIALPFMIALLTPLGVDAPAASARGWRRAGAVLALVSIAGVGWVATMDGFSARHPRPGDFFAVNDLRDGRAYWATTSGADELPSGKAAPITLLPESRFKILGQRAAIPAPSAERQLAISVAAAGPKSTWRITSSRPPRVMIIALRPTAAMTGVRINGVPVTLPADQWTPLYYRAAKPVDIMIEADGVATGGQLAMQTLLASPGLPAGAPRPAGLETNWTMLTGTEVVLDAWPVKAAATAKP